MSDEETQEGHEKASPWRYRRNLCTILDDVKNINESRRYDLLAGLIEEMQLRSNRIESYRFEERDMVEMHQRWTELRREVKDVNREFDIKQKEYHDIIKMTEDARQEYKELTGKKL